MLVKQTRMKPTRKLSAATVGAALIAIAGLFLKNLAPAWFDPQVMLTITPIVIFLIGYVVHDEDNTPEQDA